MYEVLLYFAPYLASLYNAKYQTNFKLSDLLDDIFNGSSIPRGGWGSITGTWGKYQVNGLMGSTSDGGGYAFAMNTFAAAYAMSPLVKYDIRYADTMGKWYLNLVSNARYFFPDQTEKENQSGFLDEDSKAFLEQTNSVIPYEGIRKSFNSKTPWFGGDPTVYGWAKTDFSLYSGAHIGLLGAIIKQTDVDKILKIDVNKADVCDRNAMKRFLIYNPYSEEKEITYQINNSFAIDLYDGVTGNYLAKNVQAECKIKIPKQKAVLVIELPTETEVVHKNKIYQANGQFLRADTVNTQVINYKNNDTVSGNFKIKIAAFSTIEEDTIKEIRVKEKEQEKVIPSEELNQKVKSFEEKKQQQSSQQENSQQEKSQQERFSQQEVQIDYSSKEIGVGSHTFFIEVTMESGLQDWIELRLKVEE